MSKVVFAIPSVDGQDITKGKEYEVIDDGLSFFEIADDVGCRIGCLWDGCYHLNGANWQRIEKESSKCKV